MRRDDAQRVDAIHLYRPIMEACRVAGNVAAAMGVLPALLNSEQRAAGSETHPCTFARVAHACEAPVPEGPRANNRPIPRPQRAAVCAARLTAAGAASLAPAASVAGAQRVEKL